MRYCCPAECGSWRQPPARPSSLDRSSPNYWAPLRCTRIDHRAASSICSGESAIDGGGKAGLVQQTFHRPCFGPICLAVPRNCRHRHVIKSRHLPLLPCEIISVLLRLATGWPAPTTQELWIWLSLWPVGTVLAAEDRWLVEHACSIRSVRTRARAARAGESRVWWGTASSS